MSTVEQPKTDLLPLEKLANVKENKTSKREKKKEQIIVYVVNNLKSNPSLSRNDVASVSNACQLVENIVKKKDKIDKLELVLQIFSRLFLNAPLQPNEIEWFKNTVNHLLDSKQIKRIAKHIEFYSYVKKVFISNFLFRDA